MSDVYEKLELGRFIPHWGLHTLGFEALYLELQGKRFDLMSVRSPNPNFMNGVPELLILRLLKDREMYGYELVQAIRDATRDEIVLGEGVVYPVLHGLEKDGALKSRRKAVGGRTRVYYAVTASGQKRLGALIGTWTKLNDAVAQALNGGSHAPLAV